MASASEMLALLPTPTAKPAWWHRLILPKGNLGPATKVVLLLVMGVPLLLILARIAAYPEVPGHGGLDLGFLRPLGVTLNNHWTLTWLPASQRPTVLYLLMMPTGALIIVLARLTFGLRVFGLRAILIAIGIQEVGVIPSLTLIAVVIAVILAIRPALRNIRLPLYARITVILSICSALMVVALLAGPLVRSETIWSMAFFPVIITAMIAEAVAKSIAEDSALMAAWRVVWTIAIALLFAGVGWVGPVAAMMLAFPELMLLQLAVIIVIAEYFDWRLMEGTPEKIQRVIEEKDWSMWFAPPAARIAVVRNPSRPGLIRHPGNGVPLEQSSPSLKPLLRALRNQGAVVKVFEGDATLLPELQRFLPPDARTGAPRGLVLNLATGVQGIGMETHVPAMLELAGIAYSGPDPVVQGHLLDRATLLSRLQRAGLEVPKSWCLGHTDVQALRFPLWVHPSHHMALPPAKITSLKKLDAYVMEVPVPLRNHLTLEEVVEGREIRAALIGNDRIECLPLLEKVTGRRGRSCPADLDEALAARIRDAAIATFLGAGCRDYARVDMRVTADGRIIIVQVNVHEILASGGSFTQAAQAAGLSYDELINRIIQAARERCFAHGTH